MSYIFIVIGLLLLIKGADYFVEGCSSIAKSLGIPTLIIGLTIVAFGTSAPEAAVSITASIKGANEIAIGNVVGSNICNLLLILGLSGLFGKLKANKEILVRDFPYYILSILILIIMSINFFDNINGVGILNEMHGFILLCFMSVYLYILIFSALKNNKIKNEKKEKIKLKNILLTIFGLLSIIVGGKIVVTCATNIAESMHISQNVIALTIVAVGTSLPELVTSIVATKKGELDIAIGNVVGSNIFNVFFILGLSSVISPITFGLESFIDIIVSLLATIFTFILILNKNSIGKKKSFILLVTYIIYLIYIIYR